MKLNGKLARILPLAAGGVLLLSGVFLLVRGVSVWRATGGGPGSPGNFSAGGAFGAGSGGVSAASAPAKADDSSIAAASSLAAPPAVDASLAEDTSGVAGLGVGEDGLPAEVLLPMENVLQLPELANGCEASALASMLQYYGFSADKTDLAYNWISHREFTFQNGVRYGGSPENVYMGDPAANGYYCYPGVVAEAANRYLEAQGSALRAYDISGAEEEAFVEYIASGTPVLVWKTTDNDRPYIDPSLSWVISETGEEYIPYINLHVAVLSGYDNNHFTLCDPLGSMDSIARGYLMRNYRQAGARALVIQ